MMQIAFASDENYFIGLAMALASALGSCSCEDTIQVHVIDGGLRSASIQTLEEIVVRSGRNAVLKFHTIDKSQFEGVRLLSGSVLTYARLLLPDLLNGIGEVIYGDVDIYYGSDLMDLWNIDCHGKAGVVVRDSVFPCLENDDPWLEANSKDGGLPYFNAGVMKMNLDYWREQGVGKRAIALAQKDADRCKCWDQTVLNHLLRGEMVWADERHNYLVGEYEKKDVTTSELVGKNLHYICRIKPWMRYSRNAACRLWREKRAELIPELSGYAWKFEFLAGYVWGAWFVGSAFFKTICRFLLWTRLSGIIPGLSEEKLRMHLERN